MIGFDLERKAAELARQGSIDPWRALMFVLLLHLNEVELPEPIRPAIAIANAYWHGHDGNDADLLSAKAMCWTYLDLK